MRKLLLPVLAILLWSSISYTQVVISQVYGGGGNTGATYKNDFIEIFNRGTSPVNLAGWSVQYASSTGTSWSKTNLTSITLASGQYYLIQQAAGAGGSTNLPTPDATGSIAMSATSGKVVLLNVNTLIASGTSCPTGGTVVDIVGYGSANCSEISPTATISNTTAALRLSNGCTETQNNNSDFSIGAPTPRNTASILNPCVVPVTLNINDVSLSEGNSGTTSINFTVSLTSPSPAGGVTFDITTQDNTATTSNNDYVLRSLSGQTITAGNTTYSFTVTVNGDITPEPNETFFVNITNITGALAGDVQGLGTILNDDCAPTHTIAQIQGVGNTSPHTGNIVTTSGIVTGIKTNGFFLQTPDAEADADPTTSDGIFVFTSGVPPAAVVVGNRLCVTGTVTEFIPGADPNSLSLTEITSPSVFVITTGNPLPAPITLSTTNTDPAGGIYQLEKFESMRVKVSSLTVVAPTGGNVSEANATSTSNGYFYGVITGINRPFREPGIQVPDPLPAGAPATVTRWDANPEIIAVASRGLFNGTIIDVATGAILTNVTGPLDYSRRFYTIDIDLPAVTPLPVISNNNLSFTPVPAQVNIELTVASFNIERFFDNINDPLIGEPVLTPAAYNNRLNKASLAIRNVLRSPDVIGMVEIENLSTLQTLAGKINADAVAAGDPNPNYSAYLVEGNDVGGIDVGFLVKSARVTVASVIQYGKTTTYINPENGQPELLNDRPPLVLNGGFNKPGCTSPYPFMVIVNHLRSLNGIDDPADGNRVRVKRRAQAEYLANLIQSFQVANPAANIISVGDYNAFQFNDGFVDLIGTIKGTPTAAANVVLGSADLVNPDLADLVDTHTPDQRYSYSFSGSAQVLDHILVNQNALNKVSRFSVARLDADFPEIYRNDATRPERISDHDAPVAYILFPAPTCTITAIPENNIYTGGVPTNIYLGYGPQKVTLQANAVGDAPFTYSWVGSNLSCYNCAAPVFTPTSAGSYNFTVTVTNNYGCITTCSITICVTDIRVPGTNGKKVYLCHAPPGNPSNSQSLSLSVNAVNQHLVNHSEDRLGQCGQAPCSAPEMLVYENGGKVVEGSLLTVAVSPNPSSTDFTLRVTGRDNQTLSLRVTDIYGRIILQRTGLPAGSNLKIGSDLMPGIYYVEVRQGEDLKTVKLVKLDR